MIKEMDVATLKEMINFIYTDSFDAQSVNIVDLVKKINYF